MQVETTTRLVSVTRGDVFKWTKPSAYGNSALLIVDEDVTKPYMNVPFVSCGMGRWLGSLAWLSETLDAGDIVYVGTIDNILI